MVQAVVFPGLRMWDEVSFSPINRTVCTSVFFFTEKCALCWIAYQLFQTRNVKVLKLTGGFKDRCPLQLNLLWSQSQMFYQFSTSGI